MFNLPGFGSEHGWQEVSKGPIFLPEGPVGFDDFEEYLSHQDIRGGEESYRDRPQYMLTPQGSDALERLRDRFDRIPMKPDREFEMFRFLTLVGSGHVQDDSFSHSSTARRALQMGLVS